jgi:LAO/AO transport system kinase
VQGDTDTRNLARAISIAEAGGSEARELLQGAHADASRALVVGITGPPGAGKSTLIDRLITAYRQEKQRVAVIAVDPSSPFTGGAILGDRVRMQGHAGDSGVFVRSMATRGATGGLARATSDAVTLVGAAGFDIILIETVGVGQGEIDVARLADVTIVLVVPGAGDDIQALKAGLMEIADVFVVNKADRDGADAAVAAVEAALTLADRTAGSWRPPVVRTSAATGAGIDDLVHAIDTCRKVEGRIDAKRRRRTLWRLEEAIRAQALEAVVNRQTPDGWNALVERVASGASAPETVAASLLEGFGARTAGELDHVGIAVARLEDGQAVFSSGLGLFAGEVETIEAHQARVMFLGAGDTRIELVAPTTDSSPVARFVETRGPGLHHIAFRVADLPRELARLRDRGIRLIDEAPRPGAHGRLVAFIHPASTGGVLVELVQSAGG